MNIYFLLEMRSEIDRFENFIKNEEELKQFIERRSSFEEVNDKELNMFIEYYNNKDKNIVLNYISNKTREMSDEEKVDSIVDIISPFSSVYDEEILDIFLISVQDKNKILDRGINFIGSKVGERILNEIDISIVAEYIKTNVESNFKIVQYYMNQQNVIQILNQMNEIDKTNFIMEYIQSIKGDTINNEFFNKLVFETKDDFCRSALIIFRRNQFNIGVEVFQNVLLEYKEIKEQLEQITDEKEKVDFITRLEDNEKKVGFLEQIELKQDRKSIIQSFSKEIDPRIEPQVELVQKMITEFFEDKMGKKLTEQQKEKLDIVFAKTSVAFGDLEKPTNGIAHHIYDSIEISNRHVNNLSKTILFLLHEYGHILSLQNLKKDNYFPNRDIEEGMQDLFSELVTNHYIEKHGHIELEGKKVRMDYPCKSYSAYDNENSWVRTMLYPLEKEGKDIETVTEYILGDKNRFLELTLGKEKADKKTCDLFGNRYIDLTIEELYEQMIGDFENDNIKESVYGRRNSFLPIFILQKKLEKTDIKFFELAPNTKYNCDYVAGKYFEGRKLYEITTEELSRFIELYDEQQEIFIFKYDVFMNKMINELTEEEIMEYSTEILQTTSILVRKIREMGSNLENVWNIALVKERENIENGQCVRVSAYKYKKIINTYINLLSEVNGDASEFLLDGVKDLKESYLQQIEENIIKGNVEEVLDGLKDINDGTIYTDQDILAIFEKLNVKFEKVQIMGTSYRSQDILESAIRAEIKLDDVKRISVILEKDRSDIGERTND